MRQSAAVPTTLEMKIAAGEVGSKMNERKETRPSELEKATQADSSGKDRRTSTRWAREATARKAREATTEAKSAPMRCSAEKPPES
jgi:hypothetical protein